ncbi:MAG TPA: hypothetical protein VFG30_08370, partial [Polyangiales bacterium]|nr:hypothetical protein [Polyangiales bacterium]
MMMTLESTIDVAPAATTRAAAEMSLPPARLLRAFNFVPLRLRYLSLYAWGKMAVGRPSSEVCASRLAGVSLAADQLRLQKSPQDVVEAMETEYFARWALLVATLFQREWRSSPFLTIHGLDEVRALGKTGPILFLGTHFGMHWMVGNFLRSIKAPLHPLIFHTEVAYLAVAEKWMRASEPRLNEIRPIAIPQADSLLKATAALRQGHAVYIVPDTDTGSVGKKYNANLLGRTLSVRGPETLSRICNAPIVFCYVERRGGSNPLDHT